MWHEARKQERKIRGMLVDYRKRAERRQDFYEKIKADPTQFMQIHSRKCKIHLDPAVAAAGDSPAIMMPWQGMQDNMIDRFDGRAYLDLDKIPVAPRPMKDGTLDVELSSEERLCNYERYRILAQNDFLTISEEKYLQQLHLEEQFGIQAQIEMEKPKKKLGTGAAIGYTYEDSSEPMGQSFSQTLANVAGGVGSNQADDDSDSDLDVDVAIDISKIDTSQAHELNACGRHYGMKSNDFYSFLTRDADEADALKLAREEEQEKIMLSGRKSRRERRAQRERRFAGRTISPPSYAAKEEPVGLADDDEDRAESAESRSSSPDNSGKITYITSFGGEDELQPHSKISINFNKTPTTADARYRSVDGSGQTSVSYADKVRENLEKLKSLNKMAANNSSSDSPKKPLAYQRRRSHSRSRSRSRSFGRRRRDDLIRKRHSRSRSQSRSRRNRSRSGSRNRSSRYSRSASRYHGSRRSRSPRRRRYKSSSSRSSSSSNVSRKRRRRRQASSSSSSTSPASSSASSSSSSSRHSSRTAARRKRSKSPINDYDKRVRSDSPEDRHLTIAAVDTFATRVVSYLPEPIKSTPIQLAVPAVNAIIMDEPVIPIRRYYGRKRDNQTSSEEDGDDSINVAQEENTCISRPAKDSTTASSSKPQSSQSNSGQASSHSTNSNAISSVSSSSGRQFSTTPTVSAQQTPSLSSVFGKQPTTSTTDDTKSVAMAPRSHAIDTPSISSSSSSSNPRDRLKRKMQILLNKQYKADKLAEMEKTERQTQMQLEREEEMRELALRLRRRQRELRHKYGTPTSSHSDEDSDRNSEASQSRRPTTVVTTKQAESVNNDGAIQHAVSSLASRQHQHQPSPHRQHSPSRSRTPPAAQLQSASRIMNSGSSSRSTRDRPSRFSDARPVGRNSSRSNSRDRSEYRRNDVADIDNYRRRTNTSRNPRGNHSRENNRSRSRSPRVERGRYGAGNNGGSSSSTKGLSRKLVDY